MNDDDEGDEVADFLTLLKKTKKRGGGGVPKRGTKTFAPDATNEQQTAVDQSRDALFELIGESKPLAAQHSVGILNNNAGAWITTLQQKRGTYYQFMGHTVQGNMVLQLEEAAWLMNRHALSCTTTDLATTTVLTFEDYCSLMFASMDGWITYEKYQVYAYLKRLGYIVQRSSITHSSCRKEEKRSWMLRLGQLARQVCQRMVDLIRVLTLSLGSLSTRPLVTHYQCSNYNSVYSTLRTIKFDPWHTNQQQHQPNDDDSIAWDVYKPNPKWKKRDPGVPDFRVVVGCMNDPLPSPDHLNHLFRLLYGLPYKENAYYAIRNTRSIQSQPAFLMALVGDVEGVTFIRLQSDGVSDIVPLSSI